MELRENFLGKQYLEFCELRGKALITNTVDLSKIDWFYPTKLLPLGILVKENPRIAVIPPTNPDVLNYWNIMTGGGRMGLGTYLSMVEIPPDVSQREKMLEPLYASSDSEDIGGLDAFSLFIGEFVDNVYQHSRFSTAYVVAQKYPAKKFMEICVIDDGISIPGSFKSAGFTFKDDPTALAQAMGGKSTKPEKGRGYGLASSLNLITQGLKGECLIISGRGGSIVGKEYTYYYNMRDSCKFRGTLISIRIPYQSKKVNIYDYIGA